MEISVGYNVTTVLYLAFQEDKTVMYIFALLNNNVTNYYSKGSG